jgi:glycogen synthase
VISLSSGMIARLTSTKSPGLFIRAAALVLDQFPTAQFVFAGAPTEPSYVAAVQWLARSLGMDSQVGSLEPCCLAMFAVTLQLHVERCSSSLGL